MATIEQLKLALKKLEATNLSSGLPCREEQFAQLYNFIAQRLKKRTIIGSKSHSLAAINTHLNKTVCVCGVPGTGKTATVSAVIHKLEKETKSTASKLCPFSKIYINGNAIGGVRRLYSEIMLQITGEVMSPDQAQEKLDRWFKRNIDTENDCDETDKKPKRSKKNSKSIQADYKLIVIDEVDLLYTDKSRDVFYNLFDWPTSLNSKVILIIISNAMDLAQRFKAGRIESRIGFETIVFDSYASSDLESIFRSRLDKTLIEACFDKVAIKLVTMRVGKMSGDCRLVLNLCRDAIELAISSKEKKVTAQIINKVGFHNIDSSRIDEITSLHPVEVMILKSILIEIDQLGEQNVDVNGILNELNFMICNLKVAPLKQIMKTISTTEIQGHLEALAASEIIAIESCSVFRNAHVYLREAMHCYKQVIASVRIDC